MTDRDLNQLVLLGDVIEDIKKLRADWVYGMAPKDAIGAFDAIIDTLEGNDEEDEVPDDERP